MLFLVIQLIHPLFWGIIELKVWSLPNKGLILGMLLLQFIGGAFFYAFVFHLCFYRLFDAVFSYGERGSSDRK